MTTVDDYIAAQPDAAARAALTRVRNAIRKALPKAAEEKISYKIPAYRIPGAGMIIYFAGWKKHYSLYPATSGVKEAFQRELTRYQQSKGTIRFPLAEPVPVGLIARIARFRAKEAIAAKAASR